MEKSILKRGYLHTELISMMYKQAEKMSSAGLFQDRATITLEKFKIGLQTIANKLAQEKITVEVETANSNFSSPIILVLPTSMISLSDLMAMAKINFDRNKIDLTKILSFTQPPTVDTLHVIIDNSFCKIEKSLHGRANEVSNDISKKNGIGFNLAQAITMIQAYPDILSNQHGVDIAAQRINGQVPYLFKNGYATPMLYARPHWEASPQDLIAPFFQAENIITAEN